MATPITSSTIVDVKKALEEGLSALPALSAVRISYGLPHRDAPDEFLMIGDVDDGNQETAGMRSPSTHPRQETYSVTVLVSVLMTTESYSVTETRAFELVGVVEDFLRADANLSANYAGSGRILRALFGGVKSAREYLSEDANRREARVTCAVEVAARI